MKIKRFNESEQLDISTERVGEIVDSVKEMMAFIDDKNDFLESLLNELNNYKNESSKGNDQIDDSIASLQVAKKDVDNILDKLDNVVSNLKDYNDSGRKYLYTETK
jgi:ABC-type transporter Mla subunit MlaD